MELDFKELNASQQPDWPDQDELSLVLAELGSREPLVQPHVTDKLTAELGEVALGKGFLLQGGSCAESFYDSAEAAKGLLNVLLPMTVTLMWAGIPVTKVGRLAGQFAKPRSHPQEERGGVVLPSYRGDIVNAQDFTLTARTPDPQRMLYAYDHSQATLEALYQLTTAGFADLEKIHDWNVQFAEASSQAERYGAIATDVLRYIQFMRATGVRVDLLSEIHKARMYTSHEALLLDYEMALTRPDERGRLYGSSANMLWIGERTRSIDEAHVAYGREINNPLGVKIGPGTTSDEVVALCEILNPDNTPGRLTLISRMGELLIDKTLPPLLQAVRQKGTPVIWACDPMHGNTVTTPEGQKTRHFEVISREVIKFLDITKSESVWPGGLHLEMTGEDVTECLGGSQPNTVESLEENYTTSCDPRLNPTQSMELAFIVAEALEKNFQS